MRMRTFPARAQAVERRDSYAKQMTDAPKLPLVELSRRALLRGVACAEGGARIVLLMSKPDEPPLPRDMGAYQNLPKDEPVAAKPS
jgi:hypothetical protein